jgi:hypothetical protein
MATQPGQDGERNAVVVRADRRDGGVGVAPIGDGIRGCLLVEGDHMYGRFVEAEVGTGLSHAVKLRWLSPWSSLTSSGARKPG